MLKSYVILDLETTGATPLKDRITEIALVKYLDGQEVARWQTLVNPQTSIPQFIQSLTGITQEMVSNAPKFEEVAEQLLGYLEGAVLCAHNVRFDYGFIKAELNRMGMSLKQKVLCTVKLSRKLYPQFKSHGLSALIERHHLTCAQRHRAMGDVEVLEQFIALVKHEFSEETLQKSIAHLSKRPSLPAAIDESLIDEIPDRPGVYLFYGENKLPLYIGMSHQLRTRVMSHFSSDHRSTKEMRISQEIKHIEWIETAGEFGARLLESRLVKERQPIYNRQLRRERQLCAWQLADCAKVKPLLTLIREDEITPENRHTLFGTFRSKSQAIEVLRNIAEKASLCLKALGLESGKGPCFGSQIKRCKGVCCGKESPDIHYLRVQQALISLRYQSWPFEGKIGIKEHNIETNKTEIHLIDQFCHIATVSDVALLEESMHSKPHLSFDLDTYKLILKQLRHKDTQIISFIHTNSWLI
jgi:DNA polymerase III subunit epsilon